MADKKSEMGLKDFVESGAFEPGSRAYEKVMQDEVDQAAERYDMVKGAKKALKRIKTKEKIDQVKRFAPAVPGLGGALGAVSGISDLVSKMPKELIGTSGEIAGGMKKGGSVMSRGCKMGRNKKTKIY
jgi:hypothetical protein